MACWSVWETHEEYYLKDLAPRIAGAKSLDWLPESERPTAVALRKSLTDEQWSRLPDLIAERRRERHLGVERRRRLQEEGEREAGEARSRARAAELLKVEIAARCQSDFLSVDEMVNAHPDKDLLSPVEVHGAKADFVRRWFERSDLPDQFYLDGEQSAAVASTFGDTQVVARAGSGKTRTIAARAVFLERHCGVSPSEMILLAFNRKAADEMRERLASVDGDRLPHVMTFHALAYALVHPEEDLLFDESDGTSLGLSREIQEVIDEHLRQPDYYARIRELMLAHFRDDWERISHGRIELPMEELMAYRRALPRETLNGEYVKSFGEKLIANALFEHDILYKYERSYRWNGQAYRPDFTVFLTPSTGVIVEYFGLVGDPDYDAMSGDKRSFWAGREGWTLVECAPDDIVKNGPDAFVSALIASLKKLGVPVRKRTEEEIWRLVRTRAVDRFTSAMKNFVGRARKRNLAPLELGSMVSRHASVSSTEQMFLDIGVAIYRGYLDRIEGQGQEDFDGLLWRAVSQVANGQTRFSRARGTERGDLRQLRFVMVDEFQDLSTMFYKLLLAIRQQNPMVQLFGVGDDFQAINGFAGSELTYFTEFASYFRASVQRVLHGNYRSSVLIVETANRLMRGRGDVAIAMRPEMGDVSIARLDHFAPSAAESDRHRGDEITPAVLRLVNDFRRRNLKVVMLSRTNYVPWYVDYPEEQIGRRGVDRFVEHIRTYLPEESRSSVTGSTVHGYKGREEQGVILLDALERRYPLIHPHWVFLRLFGDSLQQIEDEERRLFYVALTRAKASLVVITDSESESPFLRAIDGNGTVSELDWSSISAVPTLGEERVEVRVYGAYEAREYLKALRYRFNGAGKYWAKSIPEAELDFGALVRTEWASTASRIDVLTEGGELLHSTLSAPPNGRASGSGRRPTTPSD